MQSQEHIKRWLEIKDLKSNNREIRNSFHRVYFADEKSIQVTLDQLKGKLEADTGCYSTIFYMVFRKSLFPLYYSELDILEHRFLQRLLVYYIHFDDSILGDFGR